MTLLYIIIASLIVSAVSFVGIILLFKKNLLEKRLDLIISIAAGSLLAVTFFDILPEALDGSLKTSTISLIILLSILFFFVVEKYFHWHHCHCPEPKHEEKKHIAYLNLIGDGLHNLLDGVLIASTFSISIPLGITTTLAIMLHEIPQEITDFSLLLYGGFTKIKALIYNFLTALTALLGAIIGYFFLQQVANVEPIILAIAAGNFIYLATADLIPELHHEKDSKKMVIQTIMLLIGVVIIWLMQRLTNV